VCEGRELFEACYLSSESELKKKLKSFHGRLLHGVKKFHANREGQDTRLFEHLANQQDPHTLFITCSDSRILTSMITQTDPGELFIVRNVGNFIPPFATSELHSEIAALEFALSLDVREIVICGHSNCGAISACKNADITRLPAQLGGWIQKIKSQLDLKIKDINELSKQNVLNQIINLQQYPFIRDRIAKNSLNIHGWFIDLEQHTILEWDSRQQAFKPIGTESAAVNLKDIDTAAYN
jgi:carbonic anhydrase